MLDLDPNRPVAAPRPAATVVLLRDPPRDAGEVEVCVMQRSHQSSFMGGAVVFPGGRVEDLDADSAWEAVATSTAGEGAWWDREGVAARVAACREALEEVGIVPLTGALDADAHAALRRAAAEGSVALREALVRAGVRLDLGALVPLARWLTPEAEKRRYDTRFFLSRAPRGQEAQSDEHEALRVYWASPSQLLSDFEAGNVALFPPTHRTLELLVGRRDVDDAFAIVRNTTLDVICPRFLVEDEAAILALPGDPRHDVREARIAGKSRYALRDGRWVSEGSDTFGR